MKEMVGGCCVCGDERGWQENPLVYCDGQDCSVAVHQACYGIVSVPLGPWFCEKCQLGGIPSRFRCDLCPMREGALKRTDKNGWAHVVCALYIPEVRFGNVSTMDPVILSQVPPDRFNKVCYICEEKGASEKAKVGACMQCNKNGCKSCFHVTCAQQEGLLCEESGVMDNIKYCGYCAHHFKKLRVKRVTEERVNKRRKKTFFKRKDPTIKAIPPYRPVGSASGSSSSSGSSNKEKNPINNNKSMPSGVGSGNVHNSNNNNNHHSTTNQLENSIRPSSNTSNKLPSAAISTSGATIGPNSTASIIASSTTTSLVTSMTSGQLKSMAGTSGIQQIPLQPTALSSIVGGTTTASSPSVGSGNPSSSAPSLPQSLPSIPPQSSSALVGGGGGPPSDGVASTTTQWPKPVPHIAYLGFNNDILHSNTSGHVVGGVTAATSTIGGGIPGTGLGALTPMAAISSVIPPPASTFAQKTSFAGNNGSTNSPRISTISSSSIGPVSSIETAPPSMGAASSGHSSATTSKVNKFPSTNPDRKRKSESKESTTSSGGGAVVATGNGEPGEKKKRRSSTKGKTVKSLLDMVAPFVEDTVSSFQREKVASQRSDGFQQQQVQQQQHQQQQQQNVQLQQHQQSSIDSVIAATAAGHQSAQQTPAPLPPERATIPNVQAGLVVPEIIEQPQLTIPVANILTGPPPPKSLPFRSPQHEPSLLPGTSGFPTSLEQLLERHWEQGSQFLMEQAAHFDIASLLTCLHQLKLENQRLEDHVVSLTGRRDHLLAVNARLSQSLGHQQQHQSPISPRISNVAPVATPFLHLQPTNSQDSSHDTSDNSASSRLSGPPNTSTPIALHQPFVGAPLVPVVTTSKAMQHTPTAATSSSIVVSPTNRAAALSSLTASPNFGTMLPVGGGAGGSGVGGSSVFSSVVNKSKPSLEPSPDRQQVAAVAAAPGSFLIPRAPTPMLATDLVRPQSALVAPNQYPVTQDPHHRNMIYQLFQQNALAMYGNAFTSLMQPHRTAAAAAMLAQGHLGAPHGGTGPPAPSTQEKS